jgi:hypothetical protein
VDPVEEQALEEGIFIRAGPPLKILHIFALIRHLQPRVKGV